jgi:hypothetical protein
MLLGWGLGAVQWTPPSLLVYMPPPSNALYTLAGVTGSMTMALVLMGVNSAVTPLAASMVTVQVADVPLHAPPQPANALPAAGVAVRVTLLPRLGHITDELQPAPFVLVHTVPLLRLTVPLPVPVANTVKGSKDCPPRTSRTE